MGRDPGAGWKLVRTAGAIILFALFISRLPARELDVVISELNYHPPVSEDDEFIELHNTGDTPVDLSGWTLAEVSFVIPRETIIAPRGFIVIARNAAQARLTYGLDDVLGNYASYLGNGRGVVTVRDGAGRLVDRVAYRDSDPWPENPDGGGPSLERTRLRADGEQQWTWRASIPIGGTPGAPNSTLIERTARTLIPTGDTWKYFKGTREPATPVGAWAARTFNDGSWPSGPSGFGYGDDDDATVLSDMRGNYTTVYIRKKFTLSDPALVESLTLSVTYDDGFVAYLNGTEVWRSASTGGTPGTPLAYTAEAADSHGTADGSDVVELAGSPLLRIGENVLAIQGLNNDVDSSDLSLIPTLGIVEVASGGLVEPAHDLEINEVLVGATPAQSFVEIYNEGLAAAQLGGYKLVTDPLGRGGYTFPAGTLAPGAFTVVAGDQLPFSLTNTSQWIGLVTAEGYFVDGVLAPDRPAGRAWGRWPDGDGDTFVLDAATRASANAFTADRRVVINEIRYHPPLGLDTEEYVELYNAGPTAVDLTGWQLANAVRLTFPEGVILMPDSYLVAAADPVAVGTRYGIANVLGPWLGRLDNADEKIDLLDPLGNRLDVVHYADEGSWPSSTAIAGPDGFGPSIELLNPGMENNHGSAWRASAGTGSPGQRNSPVIDDPPPVIRSPSHEPAQPRSGQAVTVTARVSDERGVSSVRLFYRNDGAASVTQLTMSLVARDKYTAQIPGRTNGTIVQFYISATDTTAHTRTYPATAPASVLLYQVDDSTYPAGVPLYRAILRQADYDELTTRDVYSDVLLDGTFIRGDDVTYNVGVRFRGEHSRESAIKSFRIELSHDQRFEGVKRLNLNAEDNYISDIAADFLRRSDLPTFQSRIVAYTLNRNFGNAYGGMYQRVEAEDPDFLSREFPDDDGGNLYRGRYLSDDNQADLSYLGPSQSSYVEAYEKKTNEAENDYSDVVALTNAFANTPDAQFLARMEELLDIEEWLRFFAAESVLSNQDGAISTDIGEDYYIYRRPSDGRWVILPWDQNEVFGQAGSGLFRMASAAVQRLLHEPTLMRRYLGIIRELLDGPFDPVSMAPVIDSLREYYPAAELDDVAQFVIDQQAATRARIPDALTAGLAPLYLVRSGDVWRFFRGTREPSGGTTAWTGRTFADSTWEEGPGGFGYGDGDDRTVLADMRDNYSTVYIRHSFQLDNPAAITSLTLTIRYDDGFVLYVNGTEVARRNVSGSVSYDEEASNDHEAGSSPTIIDITSFKSVLVAGTNVIAAVGVNVSLDSSDVTLDPEIYTQAQGSGCGERLFTSGGVIGLEGTAPIVETATVEVNGEPATYEVDEGRWFRELDVGTGGQLVIRALDDTGTEIAATTVDVVAVGSLTSVGGSIGTARWTAAQSPYLVTSDITIAAGSTLTIDPGVTVLVTQGSSFLVQGIVNAVGTQARPIAFGGSSCDGGWLGVRFSGTGARGTLQYCQLGGTAAAAAALRVEGGASLRLEDSHLAELDGAAVEGTGTNSQLVILDTLIEAAPSGVRCAGCIAQLEGVQFRGIFGANPCIDLDGAAASPPVVRDCSIESGGGDGIRVNGAEAQIETTSIGGMAGAGILAAGAGTTRVSLSVLHGCNRGLAAVDGGTAILDRCTITRNLLGIGANEETQGLGGGRVTGESLIVWKNSWSHFLEGSSALAITYSDFEGGYPGTGNGDFDPLFVAPTLGDFHLSEGSPAIGAGKNGVDMGALPVGGQVVPVFIRGDVNADGSVDVSDAVALLRVLFAQRQAPCLEALDANNDSSANIGDAVRILGYLFAGQAKPPAPFDACGIDTTPDGLGCDAFPACR